MPENLVPIAIGDESFLVAAEVAAHIAAVEEQARSFQEQVEEWMLAYWRSHADEKDNKLSHDFTRDMEEIEEALCTCNESHWHGEGCRLGPARPVPVSENKHG